VVVHPVEYVLSEPVIKTVNVGRTAVGTVEERRKRDDEARKARGRRGFWSLFRGCSTLLGLSVAIVLLPFLGVLGYWESSGYCARCLQRRAVDEFRVCGVPIYSKRQFVDSVHHVVGTLGLEKSKCGAEVYEQIHGAACEHHFVDRPGTRVSCRMAAPSLAPWRGPYYPRSGAIASLYQAFSNTGDRETARTIYELIDSAYPIGDYSRSEMFRACKPFLAAANVQRNPSDLVFLADLYEDLGVPLARTAVTFGEMTRRLKSVETAADFRKVLADLEPRLKPYVSPAGR